MTKWLLCLLLLVVGVDTGLRVAEAVAAAAPDEPAAAPDPEDEWPDEWLQPIEA